MIQYWGKQTADYKFCAMYLKERNSKLFFRMSPPPTAVLVNFLCLQNICKKVKTTQNIPFKANMVIVPPQQPFLPTQLPDRQAKLIKTCICSLAL